MLLFHKIDLVEQALCAGETLPDLFVLSLCRRHFSVKLQLLDLSFLKLPTQGKNLLSSLFHLVPLVLEVIAFSRKGIDLSLDIGDHGKGFAPLLEIVFDISQCCAFFGDTGKDRPFFLKGPLNGYGVVVPSGQPELHDRKERQKASKDQDQKGISGQHRSGPSGHS
jgi:hypothetical protein